MNKFRLKNHTFEYMSIMTVCFEIMISTMQISIVSFWKNLIYKVIGRRKKCLHLSKVSSNKKFSFHHVISHKKVVQWRNNRMYLSQKIKRNIVLVLHYFWNNYFFINFCYRVRRKWTMTITDELGNVQNCMVFVCEHATLGISKNYTHSYVSPARNKIVWETACPRCKY